MTPNSIFTERKSCAVVSEVWCVPGHEPNLLKALLYSWNRIKLKHLRYQWRHPNCLSIEFGAGIIQTISLFNQSVCLVPKQYDLPLLNYTWLQALAATSQYLLHVECAHSCGWHRFSPVWPNVPYKHSAMLPLWLAQLALPELHLQYHSVTGGNWFAPSCPLLLFSEIMSASMDAVLLLSSALTYLFLDL